VAERRSGPFRLNLTTASAYSHLLIGAAHSLRCHGDIWLTTAGGGLNIVTRTALRSVKRRSVMFDAETDYY